MADLPTPEMGLTMREVVSYLRQQTPVVTLSDTATAGDLLNDNKLGVVHIMPEEAGGTRFSHGMTVVYRKVSGKPNTIEIATAILHPKDRYDRKAGIRQAVKHFLDGSTVLIPNVASNAVGSISYFFAS